VLPGYAVVLGLLLRGGVFGGPTLVSLLHLSGRRELVAAAAHWSEAVAAEAGCFLPLGWLAVLCFAPAQGWLRRQLRVSLPALFVALTAAVLARVIQEAPPLAWPGAIALVLPSFGCCVGVWAAASWRRGVAARLLFLPKLAFAVAALAALLVVTLIAATESVPLPFPETVVQGGEKRRLHDLVRGKDPRAIPESETRNLRLTQRDLDVLLAWGLSFAPGSQKATVRLHADSAAFEASSILPPLAGHRAYLNLTAEAGVGVSEGHLDLRARRLRIGRLEAPGWLLRFGSPFVAAALNVEPRMKSLLRPLRRVETSEGVVGLTYSRAKLPSGFLADLFRDEEPSERAARAHVYVQHMLAGIGELPSGESKFGACLTRAFALAAARSPKSRASLENEAAIVALGILMGHPALAPIAGVEMSPEERSQAKRLYKRATVRKRVDWVQHFLVSATLTALSVEAVSNVVGLAKEELDADGGSGFSFGDLLADRAGTTFAQNATRSDAAAQRMQQRLARGFAVDDFFPPASDLPENMTEAEFRVRFGGVGGDGYLRLTEAIERRIAACPAYRTEP
jgi:hypothetical protein